MNNRPESGRNTSRTNKTIKINASPRPPQIEIQKHFDVNKINSNIINPGVETFPYVIDELDFEIPISESTLSTQKSTRKFTTPKLDTEFDLLADKTNFDDCLTLNKKVDDINKQLADLENDIQFNFYDSNLFKLKNPSGTTVTNSLANVKPLLKNKNVQNNVQIAPSVKTGSNLSARKNDPSVELKHEIMQYRKVIKEKVMEDRMEKKLEELNKVNKCTAQVKFDMMKWISQMPSSPHYTAQMGSNIQAAPDFHQMIPDESTGRFDYNDKIFENEIEFAHDFVKNTTSIQTTQPNPVPKLDLDFNLDSPTSYESPHDEALEKSAVLVSLTDLASVGKAVHKSKAELQQIKSGFQEYFDLVENIPVIIKHNSPPKESKDSRNSTSRLNTNRTYSSKSTTSTIRGVINQKPKSSRSSTKATPRVSPVPEESSIYKHIKSKYLEPKKSFTEEPLPYDYNMKRKAAEVPQTSKKWDRHTGVKIHQIARDDSYQTQTFDKAKTIKDNKLLTSKKDKLTINLNDTFSIDPQDRSPTTPDYIKKCKELEAKLNSPESPVPIKKLKPVSDQISSKKSPELINKCTQIDEQLITEKIPVHKPDLELLTKLLNVVENKNKLKVQKLPKIDIRRPLVTQKIPELIIMPEEAVQSENIFQENIKYLEISYHDLPSKASINPQSSQSPPRKVISPKVSIAELSKNTEVSIMEEAKLPEVIELDKNVDVPEVIDRKTDCVEEKIIENKLTISQELNINIDNLPSIRTLNEIQKYLENRCALIKTRIAEKSTKPEEAFSLRWKLKEAPRWSPESSENQCSGNSSIQSSNKFETKIDNTENQTSGESSINDSPNSYSKFDLKLKKITEHKIEISQTVKAGSSELPTTSSIENNKSFLQKIDRIIAEKKETMYDNKDVINHTTPAPIPIQFDKSTQYSTAESLSAKTPDPILSELKNKPVDASFKEDLKCTSICDEQLVAEPVKLRPRCILTRQTKTIDVIEPDSYDEPTKLPTIHETESTESSKTTSEEESVESTSKEIKEHDKIISVEEKSNDSINQNEKKSCKQVSFVTYKTHMPLPPEVIEENEANIACALKSTNLTIELHDEEVVQQVIDFSGFATQSDKDELKNKSILTEEPNTSEPNEFIYRSELLEIINSIRISNSKVLKENSSQYSIPETDSNSLEQPKKLVQNTTKDSITQYSPTDSNRSKKSNKQTDRRSCTTQYSPKDTKLKEIEPNSTCNLQNLEPYENQVSDQKPKRRVYKYKKCSTPVDSETTTASEIDSDGILLSDGELKLSCQCSTSIGEIHLCRYANDIRRKVKALKQNPETLLRHSLNDSSVGLQRRYKHNDNWISYYISRSSSGEYNTSSYISSIPSNSDADHK